MKDFLKDQWGFLLWVVVGLVLIISGAIYKELHETTQDDILTDLQARIERLEND